MSTPNSCDDLLPSPDPSADIDVDPGAAVSAVVKRTRPELTLSEVGRRITEYYRREASEFPPADPNEMKTKFRK